MVRYYSRAARRQWRGGKPTTVDRRQNNSKRRVSKSEKASRAKHLFYPLFSEETAKVRANFLSSQTKVRGYVCTSLGPGYCPILEQRSQAARWCELPSCPPRANYPSCPPRANYPSCLRQFMSGRKTCINPYAKGNNTGMSMSQLGGSGSSNTATEGDRRWSCRGSNIIN